MNVAVLSGDFRTFFFFLLSVGPSKKKKKKIGVYSRAVCIGIIIASNQIQVKGNVQYTF